MKKLLIGILILGSALIVSGCADKPSQTSAANTQTEQTAVQDNLSNNTDNADTNNQPDTSKSNVSKADDSKTNGKEDKIKSDLNSGEEKQKNDSIDKETSTKDDSSNKNSTKTSETKTVSDSTKDKKTTVKPATKPTKKEAEVAKKTSTPSKNEVVKDRVTQNKIESSNDTMAKYYGTWRIDEVIGYTKITTADTRPLNKTLVLSKNKYTNNSFGFTIENPKYLIAKIPEKTFCNGYKLDSLKGTGLKGDTITALDITSSTNPNSDFDELYIQDGYLVYLQDGVFFKCVRQ